MALRTWPKDFEKKDHISRQEKALLRMASRNFGDGCIAVNIDPIGFSNASTKMGFYISPAEGLISFSLFSDTINESNVEIYKSYVTMVENRIYERLLDAKVLIAKADNHKVLCFPYKHIIMFPSNHEKSISLSSVTITSLLPYATFEFFRPLNSSGKEKRLSEYGIFTNVRKPYANFNCHISDDQCCAIFERLAPEYTVIMNETEPVTLPTLRGVLPESDYLITGKEHEFKTFFLDDYQVGIVNEMRRGHRVVLANPGAGKSVLLLSRAFKYASMFKESRVLLTCYNNNLADSYCFKRSCADFGDNKNLYIMTFHKLVKKIYEECLHTRLVTNIASEEEIKRCIEAVKNGSISGVAGKTRQHVSLDAAAIYGRADCKISSAMAAEAL